MTIAFELADATEGLVCATININLSQSGLTTMDLVTCVDKGPSRWLALFNTPLGCSVGIGHTQLIQGTSSSTTGDICPHFSVHPSCYCQRLHCQALLAFSSKCCTLILIDGYRITTTKLSKKIINVKAIVELCSLTLYQICIEHSFVIFADPSSKFSRWPL